MGYSKSKHAESAQKLLNQGKIAQAVHEYRLILKQDPRDQVTLMTVAELYIRQGDPSQASDYFEQLAKIFVADGFLTKAIAVYKRIAKLAPEEIHPLERLADLYVQHGVMSEARPLFLQLAEIHLKNNRKAEAVVPLKKLLAAEPENLRIQIRLADLYNVMGQTKEAVETYVDAAQLCLARGEHAESKKLAEKALKLDPQNAAAVTLKARTYAAQGKLADAAQQLEVASGLEKGGEQSEFLLDLYVKNSRWKDAIALAVRVSDADEKNFGPAEKVAEALLEAGQYESAQSIIGRIRRPMLDAGEHETLSRLLAALVAKLPGRVELLEWLVDTYGHASDSFRLPDALGQLGEALVAAGNLERAKEVFEQLLDREPDSEAAKRKLNEVRRKLGLVTAPEPEVAVVLEQTLPVERAKPEEFSVRSEAPVEKIAAAKPVAPEKVRPDGDTERFIAQSLTDVDLFASYGLTQKAIGLLEAVLRRAPRYAPALEKLLDFALGAGDDRRTAGLAAQLEQIHHARGEEPAAERFGELRRRFQRAAGLSDAELMEATAQDAAPVPPAVEAAAVVEPQPVTPTAPEGKAPTTGVHEIDLSEEWSSLLAEIPAVEAPRAASPAEGEKIRELEPVLDLDQDFDLVLEAEPLVPAHEQAASLPSAVTPGEKQAVRPAPPMSSDQFLEQLASEIQELGIGKLSPEFSKPAPKAPAAAKSSARGRGKAASPPQGSAEDSPLKQVFEEFRAELGEMGAGEEDLETHYSLGIAFREMGLLEEAISEFQKVAKASDHGRAFRYGMQCCTLLGLAFMEKSQPAVAAHWYQRALETPDIEPESALALRYDLGVAQESAGDPEAALKSFTKVYAVNIDYRDVAERIAGLEKAAR